MHNNCDDPEILGDIERCIAKARLGDTIATEYGKAVDSESDSDAEEDESTMALVSSCATTVSDRMNVDMRVHLINYLRAYRSMC